MNNNMMNNQANNVPNTNQPPMQPTQPIPNNQPPMQPTQPMPNNQPPMQPTQPMPNNQPAMQPTQPMPNNQPPMMNNTTYGQPINNQSNNNSKFIIIGVAVVVLVAVVVGAIFLLGNKEDKKESETPSNTNTPADEEVNKASKVNFNGYQFEIPSDYVSTLNDTQLLVTDARQTWVLVFEISTGSYDVIKSRRTQLIPAFQSRGQTAKNLNVKTIDGVEFITLEVTSGGTNMVTGYTKLDSNHTIVVVGANINGTLNYSLLNNAVPIIKSATASSSHAISSDSMNQTEDILEKFGFAQ